MFKKDSMLLGILIGIIVTVAGYFLLEWMNVWVSEYFFNKPAIFTRRTIEVIAIFLNVFPFRYCMLKANKELTGRGILMVTFVVGLTYFFYYLK